MLYILNSLLTYSIINTLMSKEDPFELIRTIHPNMTVEQAIKNVRERNRLEYNRTTKPVYKARNKLLQQNGFDPKDWDYFINYLPLGQSYETRDIDEIDLNAFGKSFPPGVEFLAVPGGIHGGVLGGLGNLRGSTYRFVEAEFTIYVKAKQKLLYG